jgi:glutamate decarboxylase
MPLHTHESGPPAHEKMLHFRPQFTLGEVSDVPKFRLANRGLPSGIAYEIIHDELLLDGNARLNLATFVTTWMERDAEKLMAECSAKNMIDKDEYPITAELERRCVNIVAHLWHASEQTDATGCSTTGSSEACMLGGLALKWRWRQRRQAAGQPADRPNLVMGANVQVCWEKFCRYWDVEPRLVSVGPSATCLTPEAAVSHCDENTIGVVGILGSTYDGVYEPIAEISSALDNLQASSGLDVPMHVDAASGGFIAPFIDRDLMWDFRVHRVQSINASGHKYGLVYPGVGWVIWRESAALPQDLVFNVDYLGGQMPTFALNFSRPGAQVVAQYYNFLRLGFEGFQLVQQTARDLGQWLAAEISGLGPFDLVSKGPGIPAITFRLRDESAPYTVYDISEMLRVHGWLVPAYPMPAGLDDMHVLRVVIRNGFSRDLGELLLDDIKEAIQRLSTDRRQRPPKVGFHH